MDSRVDLFDGHGGEEARNEDENVEDRNEEVRQ